MSASSKVRAAVFLIVNYEKEKKKREKKISKNRFIKLNHWISGVIPEIFLHVHAIDGKIHLVTTGENPDSVRSDIR